MRFTVPPTILKKIESTIGTTGRVLISRAPGRINLIGEHTDYNNGLVLPGAIDKYMYLAIKPNGTNSINATALDLNESAQISLDNLVKSEHEWLNYFIGILLQFQQRGIQFIGFDCAFSSEVMIGAGMSSSAALECAILLGLKELFGAQKLNNWDLINMSQSSNHNFLGIKGGIMDQFASLFGKEDHVMLLDCASSEHKYVHLPESEYTWLLINSCVKHNHLTSGYNDRVKECKQAVVDIQKVLPDVNYLSDISEPAQLASVSFESEVVEKRAHFVIEENARVRSFVRALTDSDWPTCGQLLYESHRGLSESYEVSCDELDYLVESVKNIAGVLGSRMMGGGFGGCTINLLHKSSIINIEEKISEKYFAAFNIEPQFYEINISDGASLTVLDSADNIT